ncbi:MAG: 2-C-methyl-D-erythritol 4-phosphate cytidylyltransferase [Gammaproteobacteria bacterium]
MLVHALEALGSHPRVRAITVVLANDDAWFEQLQFSVAAHVDRVTGGATRAASVLNGLLHIRERHPTDWVMVHDAARPCVSAECIDRLLEEGMACEDGAILAVPVRDTLKREDGEGRIAETVDREGMWAAQTPQLFRLDALIDAIGAQLRSGAAPTDEAAAMEQAGARPRLVMGSVSNLKITWPEDIATMSKCLVRAGDA